MPEQRQFRDDDTQIWIPRYGDSSKGAKVYASNHTMDSSDGAYYSRLYGASIGGYTANTPDLADGTYNLPCKVVQSQGTGANSSPNWELNYLISVSGGVGTFAYKFTLPFSSGAQVITANPYQSITVNNGVLLSPPGFNGNYGGELFLFSSIVVDNSLGGTLNLQGLGFRGATNTGVDDNGWCGEGTGGGQRQGNTYGNTGGNGGGNYHVNSSGGAQLNTIYAPGTINAFATPETTTDGLKINMGGAGASGTGNNAGNGNGGNGSAILTIISRKILSGIIAGNGSNGVNASGSGRPGAGGAAAFAILKGQIVQIGTNLASFAGGSAGSGSSDPEASGGDVGGMHIDAPVLSLVTGTITQTLVTAVQHILQDLRGASVIAVM